ncbi:MAG: Ferripyoverdine receptor precursor [Verrucomicrobiota bacterium]
MTYPRPRLARLVGLLALVARVSAQTSPAVPPPEAPVVTLSPFEVNATQDRGYRATNSVSATRLNTPLNELPLTLNVFTEEFIRDLNPVQIRDIARFAPSIASEASGFRNGFNRQTVRGFRNDPIRNGFTYAGRGFADPFNVNRVEVVKGPASVLYGAVSPGGLVNYITRRPAAARRAEVGLYTGSHDFLRSELIASQPLLEGRVRTGLSAVRMSRGRDTIGTDEDRLGFAPVVEIRPFKNHLLTFEYEYVRSAEKQGGGVPLNNPNPVTGQQGFNGFVPLPRSFNAAGLDDYRDADLDGLTLTYESRLAGWIARVVYEYNYAGVDQFYSGEGNALGFNRRNTTVPNQLTSAVGPILQRRVRQNIQNNETAVWQAELTREFLFDRHQFRFLVGYQQTDAEQREKGRELATNQRVPDWDLGNPATWNRRNRVTAPDQLPAFSFLQNTITDATGAYAVGTAAFFDRRAHVLGGVRRSTAGGFLRNAATGVINETTRISAREWSPQLGLLVKARPGLAAFASWSRSFVPQRGSRLEADVPAGPKPPVLGEGYDVGVKADLFGDKVSATLTFFRLDNIGELRDVFLPDASNVLRTTSRPSGELRTEGVEFEATLKPVAGLQILVSASNIDGYVRRNLATPALTGTPLVSLPKNLFNLWAKYTVGRGPLKDVWLGAGLNYSSAKIARQDDLGFSLPAATAYRAGAGYTWKPRAGRLRYHANLTVENLTDADYYNNTFDREDRRRFSLSLRAEF